MNWNAYTIASEWATFIVAFGVLGNSLESLRAVRIYSDRNLLSWRVLRTQHLSTMSGPLAVVCDRLFTERGYRRIIVAGALASLGTIIMFATGGPLWVGALGMLLVQALMLIRSYYGRNGSDHARLILLTGVLIALFPGASSGLVLVASWFVVTQVAMSYTIAGIAKLLSEQWRSGKAVVGVLQTRTYGTPLVAAFLMKHPGLAKLACWAVIVGETAWIGFPIYGGPVLVGLMVATGLFHLGVAILMRLGDFMIAWCATFPIVWVCLDNKGDLVSLLS
jgi:hypothetical protein